MLGVEYLQGFKMAIPFGTYNFSGEQSLSCVERINPLYGVICEWIATDKIANLHFRYGGIIEAFPSEVDDHIAWLLGYADVEDMARSWKPSSDAIVAALVGPNGWAVYKMLLARGGADNG